MHTLKGPNGTIFSFNSDFSGDIHVYTKNFSVDEHDKSVVVYISGDDLIHLVGTQIISSLIRRLERIKVLDVWSRLSG